MFKEGICKGLLLLDEDVDSLKGDDLIGELGDNCCLIGGEGSRGEAGDVETDVVFVERGLNLGESGFGASLVIGDDVSTEVNVLTLNGVLAELTGTGVFLVRVTGKLGVESLSINEVVLERFVVFKGANGEPLEGLFGGDDGGVLGGDLRILSPSSEVANG